MKLFAPLRITPHRNIQVKPSGYTLKHEEDEEGHVTCKFCSEKFANIASMMMHKKIKQREKIAICQNFNRDGCPFEEDRCWFLHIKSNETFRCNKCDKTFQTKSQFMQHRKKQHKTMVQMCKNGPLCVFSHSCWFRHEMVETIENDANIENEKVSINFLEKCKRKNLENTFDEIDLEYYETGKKNDKAKEKISYLIK